MHLNTKTLGLWGWNNFVEASHLDGMGRRCICVVNIAKDTPTKGSLFIVAKILRAISAYMAKHLNEF
jgi:hypothetical protein